MSTMDRIIYEYKVSRIPSSIIHNLTLLTTILCCVIMPLVILILCDNKIIGIVGVLFSLGLFALSLTTAVFHYLSFFVGVPFLLVSLISSVDFRSSEFKQYAIEMAYTMHERGQIDSVELQNIIEDIDMEILAYEEE